MSAIDKEIGVHAGIAAFEVLALKARVKELEAREAELLVLVSKGNVAINQLIRSEQNPHSEKIAQSASDAVTDFRRDCVLVKRACEHN